MLRNARVTKASLGLASFEFAAASELKLDWTSPGGTDYRSSTVSTEVGGSAVSALSVQLESRVVADFAVLDLGEGHEWLTSRLYLFANLLARKGLRAFVFVETQQGIRERFVGTASPQAIRWELAETFPWMELAFAKAYAGALGGWGAMTADAVIAGYLGHEEIQLPVPPAANPNEWIELKSEDPQWEHAEWLDSVRLRELLPTALTSDRVLDSGELSRQDEVRRIVLKDATFVARVDDDRHFLGLVDRMLLAESIARNASEAEGRAS
jgi:hypothetical protein